MITLLWKGLQLKFFKLDIIGKKLSKPYWNSWTIYKKIQTNIMIMRLLIITIKGFIKRKFDVNVV